MDNQTLKARLLINCGNLQTAHPLYTYAQNYVNDGLRMLVALATDQYPNYELFPEHRDASDTATLTVANTYTVAMPATFLAVQRVFSLDSAVVPTLSNSDWRPLGYVDPTAFDQLEKPTTQLSYPNVYTVRGTAIFLHPTPRATKTTYLKIDGIDDEPDLSANGDAPVLNKRWHPAILDCACHLMWNDLGSVDDAARYLSSATVKIKTVASGIVGIRRYQIKKIVRVAGF